MPLTAQSKILRAIQNSEIQPVGQDKIEYVDVRILVATNRDLKEEVKQGNFRSDLYHRLSVYPITVAALRDRAGDVGLLSGYFIEKVKRKLGIKQLKATASALQYLQQYDWPGNVRELEHVINRAALKACARQPDNKVVNIEQQDCGHLISLTHTQDTLLPDVDLKHQATPKEANTETVNLRLVTEQFQRQLIIQTLSEENGNWAATARRLSMDRANLNRIAKRLHITIVKTVV